PDRHVSTRELVVDEVHVRRGLVGEPGALVGDDHRPWNGPLGDQGDHRARRMSYRGHPPCVVHEVRGSTHLLTRDDALTDVLGCPGAEVLLTPFGKVPIAKLLALFESACGKQHPTSGTDP